MEYKRTSSIIRFAFWPNDEIPAQVSICSLVARLIANSITLIFAIASMAVGILVALGIVVGAFYGLIVSFGRLWFIWLGFAAIISLMLWWEHKGKTSTSIVLTFARAKKRKICPMIEIK